jgi:hypothetical protein
MTEPLNIAKVRIRAGSWWNWKPMMNITMLEIK